MARIALPAREEMTEQQRNVYDEAASGPRGHAPTPFMAWLHNPELAQRAQNLGAFVRFETSVPPRLARIGALLVARRWKSPYIWYTHKKGALALGIDPAIIDDIKEGRTPRFEDSLEQLIHDFSAHLQDTQSVPDDLYQACVAALGEKTLVEFVAIMGYYAFVATTLKTFEIGAPAGVQGEF